MQGLVTIRRTILFLAVCIFLTSCPDIEELSSIPEIHYKSLTFGTEYDTLIGATLNYGKIEFSFIDGDADLGVYDEINTDSTLPDSFRYGIFISLYEKVNGKYNELFFTETSTVKVKDSITVDDSVIYAEVDSLIIDTVTFNQLLPYDSKMDRVGQNKTIKGNIRVDISFPPTLPYDTMRFEFYIRDRALHKSNIEVTSDFTVSDF